MCWMPLAVAWNGPVSPIFASRVAVSVDLSLNTISICTGCTWDGWVCKFPGRAPCRRAIVRFVTARHRCGIRMAASLSFLSLSESQVGKID
jgi:hypothetical protein